MQLVGYIARRRCIGKNLAFADIQTALDETPTIASTEKSSSSQSVTTTTPSGRLIQLVFYRKSPMWNKDRDKTFPNKTSKLPYGGKVLVEICTEDGRLMEPKDFEEINKNQDDKHDEQQPASFLVRQWTLLENPRENAVADAQSSSENGISCTAYLKSRGDAFLRFNDNTLRCQPKPKPQKSISTTTSTILRPTDEEEGIFFVPTASPKNERVELFSHGDNRTKALRSSIFASWLITTFGQEYLLQSKSTSSTTTSTVLDIAGGKGKLSVELAIQGRISCTIVDPLVRKHGAKLEPRDAKRIRQAHAPHPRLVPRPFNATTFLQDESNRRLLHDARLCVGLHPDECTEDILDVALWHEKPLAIVPCCVFTGFFPLRTIQDPTTGQVVPVQTYEQFLDYLLAKDCRLQKTTLPFPGRNVVIYLLPKDNR